VAVRTFERLRVVQDIGWSILLWFGNRTQEKEKAKATEANATSPSLSNIRPVQVPTLTNEPLVHISKIN
jgi:hypothetical protein